MFFFALLALMVFGDVLWCTLALRQKQRWIRRTSFVFGALQLVGLASIFLSRGGIRLESSFPRWLHSMILAWHLILLLPWLLWRLFRRISRMVSKRSEPVTLTANEETSAPGISRREFIGAAAAIAPPLLTIAAAGIGEAQLDGFRIRRIDVPIANLPPTLDGLTIAHLSDFHVGRFTHGRVLEKIVEQTNRLNADVIALTGDFINHSLSDLPAAAEVVRALRAKHAIAGCEGNHDLFENPRRFRNEAERGGIPLLLGDTASTMIRGQRVQFLGSVWTQGEEGMRTNVENLEARRDPGAWPVLLVHHPHAWDAAEGIPLTLAGHTHGGQLMLTRRFGAGPMMYRYWSGLYTRRGNALVVSNGVGNWFPVRIQAPAEIVHLTLRRNLSTAAADSLS